MSRNHSISFSPATLRFGAIFSAIINLTDIYKVAFIANMLIGICTARHIRSGNSWFNVTAECRQMTVAFFLPNNKGDFTNTFNESFC